jgi:quercetin dioxygenase-like cupin family protein
MSAFDHAGSIRPQRIWEGVTARAVHGEQVTLSLIELDPGATVPEHNHANEQVGLMVKGSATFEIGGETGEITPGGTWCIHAHVPHSVTAGPEGAVVAEVFAPPREDWVAVETQAPGPGRWP